MMSMKRDEYQKNHWGVKSTRESTLEGSHIVLVPHDLFKTKCDVRALRTVEICTGMRFY